VGAGQILSQPDALRLALLDWMIPGLNGVDVLRAVRLQSDVPYVRLILLTSRQSQRRHHRRTGIGCGRLPDQAVRFGRAAGAGAHQKAHSASEGQSGESPKRCASEAKHDPLTCLWNRGIDDGHSATRTHARAAMAKRRRDHYPGRYRSFQKRERQLRPWRRRRSSTRSGLPSWRFRAQLRRRPPLWRRRVSDRAERLPYKDGRQSRGNYSWPHARASFRNCDWSAGNLHEPGRKPSLLQEIQIPSLAEDKVPALISGMTRCAVT